MAHANGKTILIIDDDELTQKILKTQLEALGYEIIAGMHGLEGLITLKHKMPDLIILDVMMPQMDGEKFMKIMGESDEYAKIPIMVLTTSPNLRRKFVELGCASFETKPFAPGDIALKVRKLLKPSLLILGEDTDFQIRIRHYIPESEFRIKIAEHPTALLEELGRERYQLVLIRLMQVESVTPKEFIKQIQSASRDSEIVTLIYCDAFVRGTEDNDRLAIKELKDKWTALDKVLFFDRRFQKKSVVDFIWAGLRNEEIQDDEAA